jgi:hypothetical protein
MPNVKNLMLGTVGRAARMNTSAIVGTYPMSDVVYGFRPEFGWPGVLFQVVLQGPLIPMWSNQTDVEFWLSFGGKGVKPTYHEMGSAVSLPGIGGERHILQCVVPQIDTQLGKVPVTLGVQGAGGRTIGQGLFLGYFEYKSNGIFYIYVPNGRCFDANLCLPSKHCSIVDLVGRKPPQGYRSPFSHYSR